ncbi:MAG: hypothetical protein JOY62_10705 [Acidobacteriaceae bacterium]|nr:hypothetical protein [Acidobacteriaceae bacterium]MBV9780429.1 hypothetical protein [Acidobacteriaceae bacterium]
MSPLNDDELNSLLQQAKSKPLEPSSDLTRQAVSAYRQSVASRQNWRALLRPVSIPLPVGLLGAVFLVAIGALGDHSLRRLSNTRDNHTLEARTARDYVISRDCLAPGQESSPPVASLFKEFQPVRQITPRVVGSIRDGQ